MTRIAPCLPVVLVAVVALGALVTGCDSYERPNRPLPSTFLARTLDGALVSPSELRGKPWVVNLWLPN